MTTCVASYLDNDNDNDNGNDNGNDNDNCNDNYNDNYMDNDKDENNANDNDNGYDNDNDTDNDKDNYNDNDNDNDNDNQDSFGYSPLHIAALNEYSYCASLLLTYGADITSRTKGGTSALSMIVRYRGAHNLQGQGGHLGPLHDSQVQGGT